MKNVNNKHNFQKKKKFINNCRNCGKSHGIINCPIYGLSIYVINLRRKTISLLIIKKLFTSNKINCVSVSENEINLGIDLENIKIETT